MIASSAGFAVPMGYAVYFMVYGPGGYKFKDFVKIGVLMDVLYFACCTALIPVMFPF
jgi:di/tricarboxylate transporter